MRRTVSLLMMTMVLLDFTNSVWLLSAPSRVSMESVDMRHVLRWGPLEAPCDTAVLYSVQFQGGAQEVNWHLSSYQCTLRLWSGQDVNRQPSCSQAKTLWNPFCPFMSEFELMLLNGSWVDAHECQLIPHTHCDLTLDLGSDSDYNLRVRAQCGSRLSLWTELSLPFNRRDTVLTAPEMAVTVVGDALQVSFSKLPLTAVVSVTVWKRGDELQATVHTMPAEQTMLLVPALQEGAVYCVRAHTILDNRLHSISTDAQCVSITGPDAAWKKPTTVTVTVIVTAGLLFAVFWSVVHCRPDVCQTYIRKEPLPRSLEPDWDIKIPMSPEEAEPCEEIHVCVDPLTS